MDHLWIIKIYLKVCVTAAGRNDRSTDEFATVDWMAYQGAPDGGVAGKTRIPQWWTGSTCQEITLPSVSVCSFRGKNKGVYCVVVELNRSNYRINCFPQSTNNHSKSKQKLIYELFGRLSCLFQWFLWPSCIKLKPKRTHLAIHDSLRCTKQNHLSNTLQHWTSTWTVATANWQ